MCLLSLGCRRFDIGSSNNDVNEPHPKISVPPLLGLIPTPSARLTELPAGAFLGLG